MMTATHFRTITSASLKPPCTREAFARSRRSSSSGRPSQCSRSSYCCGSGSRVRTELDSGEPDHCRDQRDDQKHPEQCHDAVVHGLAAGAPLRLRRTRSMNSASSCIARSRLTFRTVRDRPENVMTATRDRPSYLTAISSPMWLGVRNVDAHGRPGVFSQHLGGNPFL